jgi:hypothetical protein
VGRVHLGPPAFIDGLVAEQAGADEVGRSIPPSPTWSRAASMRRVRVRRGPPGPAEYERRLGVGHPDLAALLRNLAMVALERGDARSAARRLVWAIEIDEQAHGSEHHDVAVDLEALARCQERLGGLPHHPFHSSSPHWPRIGPNMLRP